MTLSELATDLRNRGFQVQSIGSFDGPTIRLRTPENRPLLEGRPIREMIEFLEKSASDNGFETYLQDSDFFIQLSAPVFGA